MYSQVVSLSSSGFLPCLPHPFRNFNSDAAPNFEATVSSSFDSASAQFVTLWQIDVGNLLSAAFTLPLGPLGAANDGQATTYLYQALNLITSYESADGLTSPVSTFLATTPRTIVASASGWIELFGPSGSPTNALGCSLINSDVGNCFSGPLTALTPGETGKPIPEVLAVTASLLSPTPSFSQSTTSLPNPFPSNTALSPASSESPGSRKPSSAGVIAGGVVGGLVGLTMISLTLVLFRRRHLLRKKQLFEDGTEVQATSEFLFPPPPSSSSSTTFQNHRGPTLLPSSKAAAFRQGGSPHLHVVHHEMDSNADAAESASNAQGQPLMNQYMVDISDRLRRLEMTENVSEEPPPTYHAEN
ncbi:hypothetical protein D9757_000993 [Collybiopsis confluens]|uniref:Uncharacterized protein n=1 Tax=Collybiopsis confluens TaxID=2823264 RepID=A0A8H5MG56_9AGAR|nr:hypothetical protein D9757_000993 [Collybiopsis confluens]